jgi:hypothetical protein
MLMTACEQTRPPHLSSAPPTHALFEGSDIPNGWDTTHTDFQHEGTWYRLMLAAKGAEHEDTDRASLHVETKGRLLKYDERTGAFRRISLPSGEAERGFVVSRLSNRIEILDGNASDGAAFSGIEGFNAAVTVLQTAELFNLDSGAKELGVVSEIQLRSNTDPDLVLRTERLPLRWRIDLSEDSSRGVNLTRIKGEQGVAPNA